VTTQDFQKQLEGYGLTTANILYRRPDHPWLLQSYVWQNYDLYPNFPAVLSGVLAEISRRRPAFGHCCAFPSCQTGGDQNSGWHFQAPLISDWIDQRALSLSKTIRLDPWASSMLRTSESFAATLSQFGVKSALGSDTCPLIHYRFFLFAKIAFQLSLYAFVTGFWPSPRL
jgi:uncharacterized protein Usg